MAVASAILRRVEREPARFVCFAGLLACLLALAATGLSFLWLPLDLLSHFTLHLALAAGAFFIGFMLPRYRLLTVVVLLLASIALIAAWPHYVSAAGDAVPQPAGEKSLRVMSFNTWLRNENAAAVVDEIARHDPDIVILLEFDREKAGVLEALARRYPHRADCIGRPYCHMAMLSKLPIDDWEARTRWRGPALIRARLGGRLAGLQVVGVHSIRAPYFRSHLIQLRALADYLERLPGGKIVAGDFNATPFSRMLRALEHRSSLKRLTYLPTWPAHYGPVPQLAIDHLFVSEGIAPLSHVRIGDSAGSDHYPIIADLSLGTHP